MEVERDLNEAAAMQSGLSEEERQQHIAEVDELKGEIASQAAATARLRHSLEQRSDIIERLTANDVHQQEKINLLKVRTLSSPYCAFAPYGKVDFCTAGNIPFFRFVTSGRFRSASSLHCMPVLILQILQAAATQYTVKLSAAHDFCSVAVPPLGSWC